MLICALGLSFCSVSCFKRAWSSGNSTAQHSIDSMSRCSEKCRNMSQHVSGFPQLLEGQFLHHAKLTELLTVLARPGRTSSNASNIKLLKIISNYCLFNLHYKSSKKTPIYWLGCISCHIQAKHSGIALKKLQAKSLSLPSKLLTPSVHWTPHSSP